MKYIRNISIIVEIDSNKSDEVLEFDNFYDAIEDFLTRISDEERLSLFGDYCKYCGIDDNTCQCFNDD